MAFGIPNSDQISGIIKDALALATADLTQVDETAMQKIHDQLHETITEMFANVSAEISVFQTELDAIIDRARDEILKPLLAESAAWRDVLSRINLNPKVTAGPA